jgi:protein gp37
MGFENGFKQGPMQSMRENARLPLFDLRMVPLGGLRMKNPIGWCDETLNVTVGCSPVSSGCDHCYAARVAQRLCQCGEQYDGIIGGFCVSKAEYIGSSFNGSTRFYPERLEKPFHWKRPRRIFVNSMGDLFHHNVTNEQIAAVFGVIACCPQHQFFILTKRVDRMLDWYTNYFDIPNSGGLRKIEVVICEADAIGALSMTDNGWSFVVKHGVGDGSIFDSRAPWPLPNLWLGVSVEDQPTADTRIPLLFQTPAANRFVSYEPALGELRFTYDNTLGMPIHCCAGHECGCRGMPIEPPPYLDLIVCGAETGPRRRQMNLDWARRVRNQCAAAGVPFWFERDSNGNETLDGVEHHPEFWK